MKKVLIITPRYPPDEGGIPQYVEKLANVLSEDFKIDILTCRRNGLGNEIKNENLRIFRHINSWGLAAYKPVKSFAERGNYDFINIQYVPHLYGWNGINLSLPLLVFLWQKQKRNISVCFHEIGILFSIKQLKRVMFAILHRINYVFLALAAKKVAFTTKKWTSISKIYFFWLKDKFVTIPAFSNLNKRSLSENEKRQLMASLGILDSETILFFLGYLHPSKLIGYVLASFEYLLKKNYNVKFICAGYETEKVPSIVGNSALKDKIITTGTCSKEKIEYYLNIADIYLCPYSDGFSERRTSAMAGLHFGLPIVTTYGSNTSRHLLAQHKDCFILAKNKRQFIRETEALVRNTAARKKIAAAGEKFYNDNFSVNRVAGIYKDKIFTH